MTMHAQRSGAVLPGQEQHSCPGLFLPCPFLRSHLAAYRGHVAISTSQHSLHAAAVTSDHSACSCPLRLRPTPVRLIQPTAIPAQAAHAPPPDCHSASVIHLQALQPTAIPVQSTLLIALHQFMYANQAKLQSTLNLIVNFTLLLKQQYVI